MNKIGKLDRLMQSVNQARKQGVNRMGDMDESNVPSSSDCSRVVWCQDADDGRWDDSASLAMVC